MAIDLGKPAMGSQTKADFVEENYDGGCQVFGEDSCFGAAT